MLLPIRWMRQADKRYRLQSWYNSSYGWFFRFREKAFVSATPILPSDPRFESQSFKIVEIQPTFDYKRPISIVQTNNVLEALKEILPQIKAQQEQPRSICFFANSVDMIHQLMSKLGIENESAVFCAEKSVEKLKKKGFKRAYEHWNSKHKMPYMWFTCRFYTAVDIELEERPDIVFVTEPYFAEYTIIDPCTDAVQAIGRFRMVLLWLFMLSMPMRTIRYAPKQASRNISKVAGMLTRLLKIFMNVQHLQKAEMLIRLHWIYCHITGCWKTVRPTISRLTILLMKHWLSLPTTILIQWWTDTRKAVCFYRNRHHLFLQIWR